MQPFIELALAIGELPLYAVAVIAVAGMLWYNHIDYDNRIRRRKDNADG